MSEAVNVLGASILIVDDQEANVTLLELLLSEAGYTNVRVTMDPTQVCALHRKHKFDLILLDLQLPGMDGFQVMEALKTNKDDPYLSVIVITAQPGHKMQALQAGAKDFISKPFDLLEVKTRIRNVLEVRLLYKLLAAHNLELEQTILERTAELRESEARFRSLTELAVDWYWEQDSKGNFIKVSGPVMDMLGIKVGSYQDDQPNEQTDGWDAVQRSVLLQKIAARQTFLDFGLTRVNPDGTPQYFRVSGQPMFNAKAVFMGYRGVGLEVL
jgi:PAS domain S-box-containing protein